jgi:hypothetical protein
LKHISAKYEPRPLLEHTDATMGTEIAIGKTMEIERIVGSQQLNQITLSQ